MAQIITSNHAECVGINDSVILPNVSYFDVSCAHVDGPSVGSEPLLDISKLPQIPSLYKFSNSFEFFGQRTNRTGQKYIID